VPSPSEGALPEAEIIKRFLEGGIGRQDTQLVGFNSSGADLPILVQRGVAHGISAAGFSSRPDKPWEGRDYFVRHGDWHIDLMNVLSPGGRMTPSLSQIALASGIPGKADVTGADVVDLWAGGEIHRIIEYNQADALTTYLLWLRVVHFAGLLTDEQYSQEQESLATVLAGRGASDTPSLLQYLNRWRTLQGA
jgi:predicted PolB exonuclease-like 3'-5' exonuclease